MQTQIQLILSDTVQLDVNRHHLYKKIKNIWQFSQLERLMSKSRH
jgi:hypothetical protein